MSSLGMAQGKKCPKCQGIMRKSKKAAVWVCGRCKHGVPIKNSTDTTDQAWFTGKTQPKKYRRRL